MTVFWILAAGLLGLALLFVVPPLLARQDRSDDPAQDDLNLALFRQQLAELDGDLATGRLERAQYDAARRDLERELLYDIDAETGGKATRQGGRWMAATLAVLVPAAAVGLYLYLGATDIIPRLEAGARSSGGADVHAAGGEALPELEVLIERLAARLDANPDDVQGWLMLGRSYFAVEQPARALDAFERAYALAPENVEVLLAYAQGLAAVEEGELSGRPAELIEQALALDADNLNARWLEGMLAFQRREFPAAVEAWEAVLPRLDPAGDQAAELRKFIAEAQRRTQPSGAADSGTTPPAETAANAAATGQDSAGPSGEAAAGRVRVHVSLDESLWYRAGADDTLFVYAKAVDGPPMPLAVRRARVEELPLTLTLDDSQAMMPNLRLSNFPQVMVAARISDSGMATPASGDLEGEAGPVVPGEDGTLSLVIDRERP